MQAAALLYCPFPSEEAARAAVDALLNTRLIACGNIIGSGASLYCWQGAREETRETFVLCKTTPALAAEAIAQLAALHPYESPAILQWEAQTTPETAAWLERETRSPAKH